MGPTGHIQVCDIHRIGGGRLENLRLQPREAMLDIPGISVLQTATPAEAAQQMRAAFPRARALHQACSVVGSSNEALIQTAGFELLFTPSRKLPNHYRIIHPAGAAGFTDDNLALLAAAFTDTTGL